MIKYCIDNSTKAYIPIHSKRNIKHLKDNFYSNLQVRLISPSKSDIGRPRKLY